MKRALLAALVFMSAVAHAQVRTKNVKFPTPGTSSSGTSSATTQTTAPRTNSAPPASQIITTRRVYTGGETLGQERAQQPFLLTLDYMTYVYNEPGVMKISGSMPGIHGNYRLHFNSERPRFLNFDARFASTSRNRYDGGVMHFHPDGTTTTTPSTESSRDSILDAKVQFGWSMLESPTSDFELLAGLGSWNLNNKVSGTASYSREASYVYLPASLNAAHKLSPDVRLIYGLDLNVWVSGQTKSKLSELGGDDMTHTQPSGTGYRLHVDTAFKLAGMGLLASIYHQGWNVDQSNIVYLSDGKGNSRAMVEPENNTRMTGLSLGATF